MPMIPAGVVDGPLEPVKECPYPLTPDGFIDNKAMTNQFAQMVADVFQEDMDVTDPNQCAGIYILVGNSVGYKAQEVSDFSGLPKAFCTKVGFNLRCNKLVSANELCGEIFDDDTTGVVFILYCLVAVGQIVTSFDAAGATTYAAIEHFPNPYIWQIKEVA